MSLIFPDATTSGQLNTAGAQAYAVPQAVILTLKAGFP